MRKSRPATRSEAAVFPDGLNRAVARRLLDNRRVRRTLPERGRLHIDRQLPFLCVYRRPPGDDDRGTERLVTSEAAYLIAPGSASHHRAVARLVETVARAMAGQFGSFLLLELWSQPWLPGDVPLPAVPAVLKPSFRVVAPRDDELASLIDTLETALSRLRPARQASEVELVQSRRCWPEGFPPLLKAATAREIGCHRLGLEVRPVYRNPSTGEVYPLVLRELRRGLTRALRRTFYRFACTRTTHCPVHYHVLGRRAVVKAVWEIDRRLAAVSDAFDFLLQVTPVNVEQAWRRFRNGRFQRRPVFHYRPLPVDPVLLKRKLYGIPVERVEDPALYQLFRDKQDELDRRLMMLLDLNTPRFAPGSVQVFGGVDDELLRVARDLLERLPARSRDDTRAGFLDVESFLPRAKAEIEHYRRQAPGFSAGIEVRDDIAGGLMVSRGTLLVSRAARIPESRAEALLAHEVGTHLLTYYNGRAQSFRQLYSGLAGYEPLQEGLAVLAEYLVGGLSRPRLRLLAGRVLAARLMLDGASFIDTFRELDRGCRFEQRTAFNVTMRIYRGGGLTKDAVYLRGLRQVLEYLAGGGSLDPLFVGKVAVGQLPIVRELQWRGVLKPPPLRPRYLDAPGVAERLDRVRSGLTLLQLIDRRAR